MSTVSLFRESQSSGYSAELGPWQAANYTKWSSKIQSYAILINYYKFSFFIALFVQVSSDREHIGVDHISHGYDLRDRTEFVLALQREGESCRIENPAVGMLRVLNSLIKSVKETGKGLVIGVC